MYSIYREQKESDGKRTTVVEVCAPTMAEVLAMDQTLARLSERALGDCVADIVSRIGNGPHDQTQG